MTAPTRLPDLRLTLPATPGPYRRADLVFLGLDHGGPSLEVRIFFNNPQADRDTPTTPENGYAGHFAIFGHGGCFGDEGHCDVPGQRRPHDHRPQHPLTPFTKHVVVTDAVRRALDAGTHDITVTIVPVLDEIPAYVPEDRITDPIRFERASIVFYE